MMDTPKHVSDLWHVLQEIARAEDSRFENQSVSEHAQRHGAEGARDISRWLEIYRQRVDADYKFRFPEHHPRYRGFCLVRRNWPTGLRWEAFADDTLAKVPVSGQPDKDSLEAAIDEYLHGRGERDSP